MWRMILFSRSAFRASSSLVSVLPSALPSPLLCSWWVSVMAVRTGHYVTQSMSVRRHTPVTLTRLAERM